MDQAEATAGELSRFLLTALSAALPEFCARHGMAEIQAIATEILPALIGEPTIKIRMTAAQIPAMQAHVSNFDADLIKKIHFTPDDHMGPSDIAIRWDQGGAVRDFAQSWHGIVSILDRQGLPLIEPVHQTQERESANVE